MKSRTLLRLVSVVAFVALMCMALSGCSLTGTTGAATAADGTAAAGGNYTTIIMLVAVIAIFYFLMIRPEKKKKKKLEEMRNSIEPGDKVTTIGGITGRVVSVGDDLITIESGEDRVRLQLTKWAISSTGIVKKEDDKQA